MSSRLKPAALTDPTDAPQGFLRTGSLALDLALGGGWPRGRIVEIFGASGGGKTTLLLTAIAQAQRDGGMGAFIDADHGVNRTTAARLGIDLERMPYHRTNCVEEALEKIDELVRSGAVRVIALDSVAALVPKSYLAHPADPTEHYEDRGFQFRLDVFFRAMLGLLSKSETTLLISNQVRHKVGVLYGTPETVPWATLTLQEFASVRVKLERVATMKDGEAVIGAECRAKVVKSRLASPFQQTDFEILFADGISAEGELFRLGLDRGVLHRRGNHAYHGERRLGQGRSEVVRLLKGDAELATQIRAAILERVSG